jgi:glyoxylase-like metal-dependent hydrolase (beta-lactamase superfamily II)
LQPRLEELNVKVHHINCGSLCPWGGPLIDGFSYTPGAHLSCHCLLIETDCSGLVLVDTGLSLRETDPVRPTLARFHQMLDRPKVNPDECAINTVRRLGFDPRDVRHIIATHLDFDHVGGIRDFPQAMVHVTTIEYQDARHARGFIQKRRYSNVPFDEHQHWSFYEANGDRWYGFQSVRDLKGLPPDILLIPLRGHTLGQVGVALEQPDGWLFHAGDAYLYRGEMDRSGRRCPIGMRLYERMLDADHEARVANQERLRHLMQEHSDEIRIFCSHDRKEFEALTGESGHIYSSDQAVPRTAHP